MIHMIRNIQGKRERKRRWMRWIHIAEVNLAAEESEMIGGEGASEPARRGRRLQSIAGLQVATRRGATGGHRGPPGAIEGHRGPPGWPWFNAGAEVKRRSQLNEWSNWTNVSCFRASDGTDRQCDRHCDRHTDRRVGISTFQLRADSGVFIYWLGRARKGPTAHCRSLPISFRFTALGVIWRAATLMTHRTAAITGERKRRKERQKKERMIPRRRRHRHWEIPRFGAIQCDRVIK